MAMNYERMWFKLRHDAEKDRDKNGDNEINPGLLDLMQLLESEEMDGDTPLAEQIARMAQILDDRGIFGSPNITTATPLPTVPPCIS